MMIKRVFRCQSEKRDGTVDLGSLWGRRRFLLSVRCRVQQYAPIMMEKVHGVQGERRWERQERAIEEAESLGGQDEGKASPQETGVPAVPGIMGSKMVVAGTHSGRLGKVR